MNIKNIHKNWTILGSDDPMWVIITDPTKKGNLWNEGEFFETGRQEIKLALEKLRPLCQPRFGRAFDFGCGIGRLSQALANYFGSVDGVDVSASMIEKANALNKNPEKVKYHLNVREDLRAFPAGAYDFIYTVISLQHVPTNFQVRYLADFLRILKPGGVAHFQTIHTHRWRRLVPNTLADWYRKIKHRGGAFIPLYGVPISRVLKIVAAGGGTLVRHESLPYEGWEGRFVSDVYIVQKAE